MNRIQLWKTAAFALLMTLFFALQPAISYACGAAGHGGC